MEKKKQKNIITKYYENNKDRVQKKARNRYRELASEEKEIKREYERNWYRICQKKIKKIKTISKNYSNASKTKKKLYIIQKKSRKIWQVVIFR